MRILYVSHIRGHGRPVPLARGCCGERWSRRARSARSKKHQDLRLLIRVARARARVTLDHSLGREEGLDLFARKSGALSGSWNGMRLAKSCLRHCETDPHAFRMLGTKAKALETETDTGLVAPPRVWLFVTFLRSGGSEWLRAGDDGGEGRPFSLFDKCSSRT